MRNHLYVDGKDLADFGVYVSGSGTFKSPAKEYAIYDVPGRAGAVIGTNPTLKNVDVTYPAGVTENLRTNMRDLRSYLLSRDGYVRISDTYNTDEYRMGIYTGELNPAVTANLDAAEFDLTFNCKPQRYLTSGETKTTITGNNSHTINNPTHFMARPLLCIYGTGAVFLTNAAGINETYIIVANNSPDPYIYVDCETLAFYNGNGDPTTYAWFGRTNGNTYSPVLMPGNNYIQAPNPFVIEGVSTPNNVTKIEITPRWWEV